MKHATTSRSRRVKVSFSTAELATINPEKKESLALPLDGVVKEKDKRKGVSLAGTLGTTYPRLHHTENSRRSLPFFDIKSVFLTEWVHEGQTINEDLRKNNTWLSHQDNASLHNPLFIQNLLADKKIPVLNYLAYSPHLTPCDFYLFPQMKESLKGNHFETLEQIRKKRQGYLAPSFLKTSKIISNNEKKTRATLCQEGRGNISRENVTNLFYFIYQIVFLIT